MIAKLLVQPRYFSRDDRAIGGLIILKTGPGVKEAQGTADSHPGRAWL